MSEPEELEELIEEIEDWDRGGRLAAFGHPLALLTREIRRLRAEREAHAETRRHLEAPLTPPAQAPDPETTHTGEDHD